MWKRGKEACSSPHGSPGWAVFNSSECLGRAHSPCILKMIPAVWEFVSLKYGSFVPSMVHLLMDCTWMCPGYPFESEVAQSCPTLCDPMDPPSMEFSRQEYWGGLPFPSPGDSRW